MPPNAPPVGRRERNKQEKLDRIVAAASQLLAENSIDDITTAQVAALADIGTGTLFLYAKTKGELLLLVQNAQYAAALETGIAAAQQPRTTTDAVLAIIEPIVACNRHQVSNGRMYLREMIFGDHEEPHHREALTIAAQTERALAQVLQRHAALSAQQAAATARIISAVMFLAMAASPNATLSTQEIVEQIREQLVVIVA